MYEYCSATTVKVPLGVGQLRLLELRLDDIAQSFESLCPVGFRLSRLLDVVREVLRQVVLVLHHVAREHGHRLHEAREDLVEVLEVLVANDEPPAERKRVRLVLLDDLHVLQDVVFVVHFPGERQLVEAYKNIEIRGSLS